MKIDVQEFYIEALFEDGHSALLSGRSTNKQIDTVILCIKTCGLTSLMDAFAKKSSPDCTGNETPVVQFTDRDIPA
jgi:hypothetical protein